MRERERERERERRGGDKPVQLARLVTDDP